MVIVFTAPSQKRAIQSHAEQVFPEECCGLLLGLHQPANESKSQTRQGHDLQDHDFQDHNFQGHDFQNTVMAVVSAENVWSESPRRQDAQQPHAGTDRRYAISAIAMVEAQQYARSKGWDIIGIYHSHPNHEAVPSEWDRAWAWPQYSYVIVSVKDGTAQDLRSWTLDINHKFLPEKLVISGATDPQVTPNFEDTP